MKRWKLLIALILIIAAIYIIPRSGKSTEIEQNGNELSITVGKAVRPVISFTAQVLELFLLIRRSN